MSISHKRSIMTLYCNDSIYSHKTRMVIAEKGLACECHHITKDNITSNFIDLQTNNQLPTLVDRDLVLYNSNIIVEYLDERFPHPPMMPVYPIAKAKIRLILFRINEDWCKLVDKITKSPNTASHKKELTDSILSVISVFDENEFFMNEEFTLADIAIAPIFWRLPALGVEIPKSFTNFHKYCDNIFKRASFQDSLNKQERAMRDDYPAE